MTPPPPALLIVGHGTRDEAGAESFRAFVRQLAAARPDLPVGGGFIELSPPPLADTVAGMVADGVREFAAVPLVLVSAGHAKGDIPAALAREERRHPGTSFRYGRPLGPHPGVLAVLERRLDQALEAPAAGADPATPPAPPSSSPSPSPGDEQGAGVDGPADRAGTTVLLVGRGSTDPDANAEVFKAARLLWEGRGLAGVEVAFISLAHPSVPEGLERCRRLGAARVIVLPYFLFTGVLPDRVREQALHWAAEHPRTDVRCADVIGPEPELAALVMERYEEARAGDVRMNCDACVYRVKLPGFEERVGLPQQPHHHPDDPGHAHGHGHGDGHSHGHGGGAGHHGHQGPHEGTGPDGDTGRGGDTGPDADGHRAPSAVRTAPHDPRPTGAR